MNIELLFKWQFICTLSCASCGDWVATHVFQFLSLNSHHELKQFFHIPILQRVHSSTNTKWYFFIISKHTSFSTTFSLVFTKTENRCVFFFFGASSFLTLFAMTLIYGAAAWVVVVSDKKYFPKNHKARPAFPDRRAAFHIESPAMPWPPIFSIQRRSESSLMSGRRLLSSLPVVLSLALWWHHQLAVALMGVFSRPVLVLRAVPPPPPPPLP